MSYRNLVDIALTVDNSELEEHLGRIDQNIEVLTDRVKSIENDGALNEDNVNDIIATYAANEGHITESEVDDKLRDHVSSDDLDSLIGDYLSSNDYPSNDDVDMKISDAIENGDFVNPSQMEEAITNALDASNLSSEVEAHGERLDALESEDSTAITDLQAKVETLQRDFQGIDEGDNERLAKAYERIEALEAKAARAERIFDKLHDLVQVLVEEQKGS